MIKWNSMGKARRKLTRKAKQNHKQKLALFLLFLLSYVSYDQVV